VIGFASGQIPADLGEHPAGQERERARLLLGSYRTHDPARVRAAFEELLRWHGHRRIEPLVFEVRPLAEAPLTLECLLSRQSRGKIVLAIDQ
jgi:NADPH2:quinone reductase